MSDFQSDLPPRVHREGLRNNRNLPESANPPVPDRLVPAPNISPQDTQSEKIEFQGSKNSENLPGAVKGQKVAKKSLSRLVDRKVKSSDSVKVLVNALFDKLPVPDSVSRQTGFYGPRAQAWISSALRDPSNWVGVSKEGKDCMTHLSSALAKSVLLSDEMDRAHFLSLKQKEAPLAKEIYKNVATNLSKEIQSLEAGSGEYILVPMGVPEHCMMSRVERQANGKFHVTFYNPGFGAIDGGHKRDPSDPRKVQAAISFEDVPEESLMKVDTWSEAFHQRKDGNYIQVYRLLGQLTEGGRRSKPEEGSDPHGVAYSISQKRNTCSFALMWAVARHEMTHLDGAPPLERLMEWRVVKAKAQQYLVDTCDLSKSKAPLASKVQSLADFKLSRMGVDLQLAGLSASEEDSIKFLQFTGLNSEEAEAKLADCHTPQARMVVLRHACENLVRDWLTGLVDTEEFLEQSAIQDPKFTKAPCALYHFFSEELKSIMEDCETEGVYRGLKLRLPYGESPPRVFEKYPEARTILIENRQWFTLANKSQADFLGLFGVLNPKLACDYLKHCVSQRHLEGECLQLVQVMLDWGVEQAAQSPKMRSWHLNLIEKNFLPFCKANNPSLHADCEAMFKEAAAQIREKRMDFLDGPNNLQNMSKKMGTGVQGALCIDARSGMKEIANEDKGAKRKLGLQTWETVTAFYEELDLDSDTFSEILQDLDNRFPKAGFAKCWNGEDLVTVPAEPHFRMELLAALSERLMERWASDGTIYFNEPESAWRFDGLMQVYKAKERAYEVLDRGVNEWLDLLEEAQFPEPGQVVRRLREYLGLESEDHSSLLQSMSFRSLGPWRFHILADMIESQDSEEVQRRFVKSLMKKNPAIAAEFEKWAVRNQENSLQDLFIKNKI